MTDRDFDEFSVSDTGVFRLVRDKDGRMADPVTQLMFNLDRMHPLLDQAARALADDGTHAAGMDPEEARKRALALPIYKRGNPSKMKEDGGELLSDVPELAPPSA